MIKPPCLPTEAIRATYRARRSMVSISWRIFRAQAAAGTEPRRSAVRLGDALVQDFSDATNELMSVYRAAASRHGSLRKKHALRRNRIK
jgi:hypothetical protein